METKTVQQKDRNYRKSKIRLKNKIQLQKYTNLISENVKAKTS